MTEQEAHETLQGTPLVEAFVAPMTEIKRLRAQCLNAEIAAAVARPNEKCGSS